MMYVPKLDINITQVIIILVIWSNWLIFFFRLLSRTTYSSFFLVSTKNNIIRPVFIFICDQYVYIKQDAIYVSCLNTKRYLFKRLTSSFFGTIRGPQVQSNLGFQTPLTLHIIWPLRNKNIRDLIGITGYKGNHRGLSVLSLGFKDQSKEVLQEIFWNKQYARWRLEKLIAFTNFQQ